MTRQQREALTAQLQATHATLQAALVQISAQIVALAAAEPLDDGGGVACPHCGRDEERGVLPAGRTAEGEPEYVCPCGKNFVLKEAAHAEV